MPRDWLLVTCDANGHDWVADGGRPCPYVDQGSVCPARNLFCSNLGLPSQPVFRCRLCPAIDYGTELGGPGWQHCQECMRRS